MLDEPHLFGDDLGRAVHAVNERKLLLVRRAQRVGKGDGDDIALRTVRNGGNRPHDTAQDATCPSAGASTTCCAFH